MLLSFAVPKMIKSFLFNSWRLISNGRNLKYSAIHSRLYLFQINEKHFFLLVSKNLLCLLVSTFLLYVRCSAILSQRFQQSLFVIIPLFRPSQVNNVSPMITCIHFCLHFPITSDDSDSPHPVMAIYSNYNWMKQQMDRTLMLSLLVYF